MIKTLEGTFVAGGPTADRWVYTCSSLLAAALEARALVTLKCEVRSCSLQESPLAGSRWVCTEARQLLYFPRFRSPGANLTKKTVLSRLPHPHSMTCSALSRGGACQQVTLSGLQPACVLLPRIPRTKWVLENKCWLSP